MTVKQATKQVYFNLPKEFHVLELVRGVKVTTGRPHLMDGTILRKLRELRSDGVLDYEPKDKGQYHKKMKVEQRKIWS